MDKTALTNKYGLIHESGGWFSHKENSHKHLIFKDTFFEKNDIIGLLFRIKKLCMAKVKYFCQHLDLFEPCKYHYKNGFIIVPLWDADFFRHKKSGLILDMDYLATVTVYDDFVRLCEELAAEKSEQQTQSMDRNGISTDGR